MRTILAALLGLVATSCFAFTVIESDQVIGYDGDCAVYYRPDYGYFEVCQASEPLFLGVDFDTVHFHREFREGPKFGHVFGGHYRGPHMGYKTQTTMKTVERHHGH